LGPHTTTQKGRLPRRNNPFSLLNLFLPPSHRATSSSCIIILNDIAIKNIETPLLKAFEEQSKSPGVDGTLQVLPWVGS
jgi:hypothetical protein